MAAHVKNVIIKDGKFKKVHRLSASKRKGVHAKAARTEKAWKAKSK